MQSSATRGELTIRLTELDTPELWADITPRWVEFLGRDTTDYNIWGNPAILRVDDSGMVERILAVEVLRGERLVAIIPLRHGIRQQWLRFGLVKLASLDLDTIQTFSDRFPVTRGEDRDALLAEAVEFLRSRKLCHLIVAPEWPLREGGASPFADKPPRKLQSSYLIDLPASYDLFLAQKSGDTRQRLRAEVKRMTKAFEGDIRLERFDRVDQVERLLADSEKIIAASWHARTGTMFLPTRDILNAAATNGWLRSYVLYVKGQPVSLGIGFQSGGLYSFEVTAYDETYATHGPGKVLCLLMIQDLLGHQAPRQADFGFGANKYKDLLCNKIGQEAEFTWPTSVRARVFLVLARSLEWLFQTSKRMLASTSVAENLKKRLRRGMSERRA